MVRGPDRSVERGDVLSKMEVGVPETAPTLAENFDVTPDTVSNRLQELNKLDEIKTKKLGKRSRVWWIPAPDRTVDADRITESMFRSAKDPHILRALARAMNRGEPLTSKEIAEEIDDSQDVVYNRLRKLNERGWVESLKTGATSMVWWLNKDKFEAETEVTASTTTVTLSEALKNHLRDVAGLNEENGVEGVGTLESALLHILENPYEEEQSVTGYEETLNDPVKVSDETLEDLKTLRDQDLDARDYEEAIREQANIKRRDIGEEPVDTSDWAG